MPGGRPTVYQGEVTCEQAYKLCLLGVDDARLAELLGISPDTLYQWKRRHPEFAETLAEGRERADANVAKSMYHRALGYTHDAEEIFVYQGAVIRVPVKKHHPPDYRSMALWLKNRQGKYWRERQEVVIESRMSDALAAAEARLRGEDGSDR